MNRTIAMALLFTSFLLAGCGGTEEKKDEPSTLPPADKAFDKSKAPGLKGGDPQNNAKKATAG